jgi:uncharacterized protein
MRGNYDSRIAQLLKVKSTQVAAAIRLLDEGNTVPFIARYRKEMTFNLDEFQIREIQENVERFRHVDERRDLILRTIDEQGKLSPELAQRVEEAETLTELEDLYQPYKPKRRTRAMIARERGLETLAQMILAQPRNAREPLDAAGDFVTDDVPTPADALQGARDIVAEVIADDADIRGEVREKALQFGTLSSTRAKGSEDPKGVFQTYYAFEGRCSNLRPHQTLALNRGESENVLRVTLTLAERDWRDPIIVRYRPDRRSDWFDELMLAIEDSAARLLLPAIERDVRRTLTEAAEAHAIEVFASNLRALLNQPPLHGRTMMGVDPAYRTGCKIAVIDASGKLLETTTIYPHEPQNRWRDAQGTLAMLIEKHRVSIISIGNGTASRETEQLIAELTRQMSGVQYAIVNEAGASVYSASDLARAELPDLDVSLRGAVSIARRMHDPLAELVKIDPKSIGVGLYQHDVNQTELSNALDAVVESVVNHVGVDVNTASPALLQYVAGIGKKLAGSIVAYRDENGAFASRIAIKKVAGMGAKSFEQAAGFLRIRAGSNPLDASAIHPESYDVAKAVLKRAGVTATQSPEKIEKAFWALLDRTPLEKLAAELETGALTLADIMEQLVRPGRDPREDVDPPLLRSDVLTMNDLKTGMQLAGTVRNVVDFGAFVDIGVKQDGLLHVSRLPRGTVLHAGDIVQVEIVSIDKERGRIGLGWSG